MKNCSSFTSVWVVIIREKIEVKWMNRKEKNQEDEQMKVKA